MNRTPRFAIRTIRNGRVKINHRWFSPRDQGLKYDSRLDGMRYEFGLYWTGDRMESYISLWGTEEIHRTHNFDLEQPEVVDGTLPWMWWDEIDDSK